MILPALIKYYDRLEADPNQDIAPLGFSRQKISFCIKLNPDGTLDAIEDMRLSADGESRSGKPIARQLILPGQSKPSGQGINPCFLWDNAAYMLGFKPEDPKPDRTRACFEGFRDRHTALRDEIDDEAFGAVCTFLKNWNPDAFTPDPATAEFLASFGIFRVGLAQEFVHDRQPIKDWWRRTEAASSEIPDHVVDRVPSLTTGLPSRIARLHEPAIKGVAGAQSSGARLVSFNENAFESYGKSQGMNAPVAEEDAFKYCTALNRLLDDRSRRTGIGDATVVWWSDQPEMVGETLAGALFGASLTEDESPTAEDAKTVERVKAAMGHIVRGLTPEDLAGSKTPFHVLGLSPNAARLSVRFWWDGTLGEMMRRLAQHHADLALGEWCHPRHLSIRRIVYETARLKQGKRDAESVPPRLVGDVTRAVIFGLPYPDALHEALLRRIRQDGEITSVQASALKAILIRKGISMDRHLDTDYPSQAYQCGRLFAVLDHAQRVASPTVKATIASRYIRSVMSSPGALLGHLQGLAQAHIRKLDSKDAQLFFHDEIKSINARISPPPPAHLLGTDQSVFMLGYYKQLAWLETVIAPGKKLGRRYRTDRGEWVLSLPEKVVMNTLNKCNINYIYEVKRLIGDAVPRVPDLLINGLDRKNDVYIEVAGGWKDMEAYNSRHETKITEYAKSGITSDGGENGYLCVLDFRNADSRNKGWYDEKAMVIDPLSKYIPALSMQTNTQEN